MKYEEYPKSMHHPSNNYKVVVHNLEEENNVIARWALDGNQIEHVNMSGARDILLKEALKVGLKVDPTWSDYAFRTALDKVS